MFGTRLRRLRKKKGLTQAELAKMLSLGESTISFYEKGKREPDYETLQRIAKVFGVTTDYLLGITNSNIPDSYPVKEFTGIPIYGEIRAGNPSLAQEEIMGYEYLPSDEIRGNEYFILRVKGDSMINARIQDGDLVLVRKQPTVEEGKIGVFLIEDEATIKIFNRQGKNAILMPANPAYKPIMDRKNNPLSRYQDKGNIEV